MVKSGLDERDQRWTGLNTITDGPNCYPESVALFTIFAGRDLQHLFARCREREEIFQRALKYHDPKTVDYLLTKAALEELQAILCYMVSNLPARAGQQLVLALGGWDGGKDGEEV